MCPVSNDSQIDGEEEAAPGDQVATIIGDAGRLA
jgi:hypothetical protein